MQSTIFDLLLTQPQSSGRTSPASCPAVTTPLVPCWQAWAAVMPPSSTQVHGQAQVWLLDRAASLHGESVMPNFGEWPSAADVSLLAVGRAAPCGGWSAADALLPIGESVPWDSEPSREAWEASARGAAGGSRAISPTVSSKWAKGSGGPSGDECQNLVAATVFQWNAGHHPRNDSDNETYIFGAQNSATQGDSVLQTTYQTLDKSKIPAVLHGLVRRLTPIECERLQGFPDNYTAIPGAADGPRYAALGNSMAVPVIRWIGRRIDAVRQRQT